jgi:hypothetical protein
MLILKHFLNGKSSSHIRKSLSVIAPSAAALNLLTTSCGPLLAINADPGVGVPATAIVKSIRCELMTYLVTNRYRQAAFLALYTTDFKSAFDNYAYLALDDNEYAAIDANLKTADMASLTVGIDWKTHVTKAGESHDKHLGPGITTTKTYIADNLYGVPQDARLGPTAPPVGYLPPAPLPQPPKFYQETDSGDVDYFCYKKEPSMAAPAVNLQTFEALSDHELPQFENFDRIFIAADTFVPMAKWLEAKGADMSRNLLSIGTNMENILPGQLSYSFALDIKPSIDLKYTLVATVISPYVPELMASREDTDTFTIYLNTQYAKFASGGKSGGTVIATAVTPDKIWGPNHGAAAVKSRGAFYRFNYNGALIQTPAPAPNAGTPFRNPGGALIAPLPLIPPAVGPGQ